MAAKRTSCLQVISQISSFEGLLKVRNICSMKLLLQLRQVYLFVSVILVCLSPYLKKIVLSKHFIFYCLVSLNSFFS